MEHAAFETPLSPEQLQEMGRLVINCGFAEFLMNIHVGLIHNVDGAGRATLVAPLTARRKIEILQARLSDIPGQQTRDFVDKACKLISPAITARNYLLHGIWGHDGEGAGAKAIVANPKDTKGFRTADEIGTHADNLAIASRLLKHALQIDGGADPTPEAERLVITP